MKLEMRVGRIDMVAGKPTVSLSNASVGASSLRHDDIEFSAWACKLKPNDLITVEFYPPEASSAVT